MQIHSWRFLFSPKNTKEAMIRQIMQWILQRRIHNDHAQCNICTLNPPSKQNNQCLSCNRAKELSYGKFKRKSVWMRRWKSCVSIALIFDMGSSICFSRCQSQRAWSFLCPGIRQKGKTMNPKSKHVPREEKATVWDRRVDLLNYLREHEQTTVEKLANELKVSRRTVLRDITALTQQYPVETTSGRYGGVYLRDTDKKAKKLTEGQKQTLKELLTFANLEQQQNIIAIINEFGS